MHLTKYPAIPLQGTYHEKGKHKIYAQMFIPTLSVIIKKKKKKNTPSTRNDHNGHQSSGMLFNNKKKWAIESHNKMHLKMQC